jgi:hypothetical protein
MEEFPYLDDRNHRITSPEDDAYNCIAWAAEDNLRWWWPRPEEFYYWPARVPRSATIDAFVAAFATLGYSPCGTGDVEPGFQKVAIYVNNENIPTHMARQEPDGAWTSKLGGDVDIRHLTLGAIEGSIYGTVGQFLRRSLTHQQSE